MRRHSALLGAVAGLALTCATWTRALAQAPAAIAAPASTAPAAAAPAAPPDDPRALRYAPLTISFPQPERFVLRNGLVIYLLRDNELPIVDLALSMRGGSIYDPQDKTGLAALTARLMRTGGTRALSPDEVDQTLEAMPATVSLAADDDVVNGSVSCLKGSFPEALRIFGDMLKEPRFDAQPLEVEKARIVEGIRRRWDNPGTIAELNFRLLAYGPQSPWAALGSIDTVKRIGRDDLVENHRRYIRPGGAIAAVSGDFDPAAMKKLLRATFDGWTGKPAVLPAVPRVEDKAPKGVFLIERPLTQSSIALGGIGVGRFDPDRFPLVLFNSILGESGFSSRLMKEVRSNRGLAYSVSGGVGSDSDRGLSQINCRTRANATVQAIDAIREVTRRLREEGPTEEEIRLAKDSEINSFAFTVDGTAAYMRAFLYYQYYGYPADYLKTWRDRLLQVRREDVLRAGRRFLQDDKMTILVVGNPKEFDRPLDTLGMGAPRPIRLGDEGGAPSLTPEAAGSSAPPSRPAAPGR